ncbi:MAG TPA: transcriptional regulator [Allosphingosinicella sp.]|nr:transcriptional regulator [Allosphingosinicella sp.]
MGELSPFDHNRLDDVIHGRIRLGVVAYLSAVESALFGELRDQVGATDGNLSAHLRKLEDAGYVRAEKSFVNRKPQTRLSLTAEGRKAWRAWLDRIDALRNAAAGRG